MTALGLIETKGLIGAIEGADAMLKAAEVRLLEKNCVGGGLVTITIAGEVSAVRASVDAGIAAIKKLDGASLVSEHVIARPDADLAHILSLSPAQPCGRSGEYLEKDEVEFCKKSEPAAILFEAENIMETVMQATQETVVDEALTSVTIITTEDSIPASAKEEAQRHNVSQLKKMSMNRLRQIAHALGGLDMTHDMLNKTAKKDLIDAIINAYRKIEE